MFRAGSGVRRRLDRRRRVSAPTANAANARPDRIHHSISYFPSAAARAQGRNAFATCATAGSIASATAAFPVSDK